jgi:hypothetical protein
MSILQSLSGEDCKKQTKLYLKLRDSVYVYKTIHIQGIVICTVNCKKVYRNQKPNGAFETPIREEQKAQKVVLAPGRLGIAVGMRTGGGEGGSLAKEKRP